MLVQLDIVRHSAVRFIIIKICNINILVYIAGLIVLMLSVRRYKMSSHAGTRTEQFYVSFLTMMMPLSLKCAGPDGPRVICYENPSILFFVSKRFISIYNNSMYR
jgi:hypothetical protein